MSHKTGPCIYGILIYDKVHIAYHWAKGGLFKTRCGRITQLFFWKKIKLLAYGSQKSIPDGLKTVSFIQFETYYLTKDTIKATKYLEYVKQKD